MIFMARRPTGQVEGQHGDAITGFGEGLGLLGYPGIVKELIPDDHADM